MIITSSDAKLQQKTVKKWKLANKVWDKVSGGERCQSTTTTVCAWNQCTETNSKNEKGKIFSIYWANFQEEGSSITWHWHTNNSSPPPAKKLYTTEAYSNVQYNRLTKSIREWNLDLHLLQCNTVAQVNLLPSSQQAGIVRSKANRKITRERWADHVCETILLTCRVSVSALTTHTHTHWH